MNLRIITILDEVLVEIEEEEEKNDAQVKKRWKFRAYGGETLTSLSSRLVNASVKT